MIAHGIVHNERRGIAAVGTVMARAFGTKTKHGVKQVGRYLSNKRFGMRATFLGFVPFVVGQRFSLFVNLDWTESDKRRSHDSQHLPRHAKGRRDAVGLDDRAKARTEKLKRRQRAYEKETLRIFKDAVRSNVHVVVLVDSVFGDTELYRYIHETLGSDSVIRYRRSFYARFDKWLCPSAALVRRNVRVQSYRTRT